MHFRESPLTGSELFPGEMFPVGKYPFCGDVSYPTPFLHLFSRLSKNLLPGSFSEYFEMGLHRFEGFRRFLSRLYQEI